MHDTFRFSVRFKDRQFSNPQDVKYHYGIDFFYGETNSFEIVAKLRPNVSFTKAKAAIRNLQTFRIRELYNFHKDIVQEIIQSAIIYNEDYVNNLMNTYKDDLFNNREDVLRMLTRQYFTLDKMPKRPFSKFSYDISSEFGIKA